MNLTEEEQRLLDSVEQGEWTTIPGFEQEAERYRAAARATLRKDKRVNIRMSERDLIHFRKAALREGCARGCRTRRSSPASCTSTSTGSSWTREAARGRLADAAAPLHRPGRALLLAAAGPAVGGGIHSQLDPDRTRQGPVPESLRHGHDAGGHDPAGAAGFRRGVVGEGARHGGRADRPGRGRGRHRLLLAQRVPGGAEAAGRHRASRHRGERRGMPAAIRPGVRLSPPRPRASSRRSRWRARTSGTCGATSSARTAAFCGSPATR